MHDMELRILPEPFGKSNRCGGAGGNDEGSILPAPRMGHRPIATNTAPRANIVAMAR